MQFKNIFDLVTKFKTEKDCHQYLASQRWSDGVITCPHCCNEKSYVFSDGIRYECVACQKQFTAKTKTFMEGSKVSSIKWLMTMFLLMHKKGISSVQLSKDIGVTQKTAWFMLHRIRAAFTNEMETEKLSGTVQLDETFVGGKNKNRHWDKKVKGSQGRSFKDKTPVMGMLQQEVSEINYRPHKVISGRIVKEKIIVNPSRLICKVIPNTGGEFLKPNVLKNIEAGSIIVSDEWIGYRGLNAVYNHQVVDHTRHQYVNVSGFTSNAMESSWTQFKLTIHATYVRPTRKHLNKYTQEFVFRHNNRNFDVQRQINLILQQGEIRLKYKDLIAA